MEIKQRNCGKKAQGAIEYLLIIGAAIIVVAVVVLAATGAMGTGKTAATSGQENVSTEFDELRAAGKLPTLGASPPGIPTPSVFINGHGYFSTDSVTTGLVGLWHFDSVNASKTVNSINGVYDNTLTSGASLIVGGFDKSLSLNGTNYSQFNSTLVFELGEPFTISAWVKTNDDFGPILSFRRQGPAYDNPVIDIVVGHNGVYPSNQKKISALIRGDTDDYVAIWSDNTINSEWHFIVLTRDSTGNIKLFVDKVKQLSTATNNRKITTDYSAVGAELRWISTVSYTLDDRYLEGQIDEVAIWNKELSDDDIATLYNNAPQRAP